MPGPNPVLPAGPQPVYKSRKLRPAGSHHPNQPADLQNIKTNDTSTTFI